MFLTKSVIIEVVVTMLNFSFFDFVSLQPKKRLQISAIKANFFIRLNISCEVTKKNIQMIAIVKLMSV